MSLHHSSMGKGPDVVLLHGWGMHSGIMSRLARKLMSDFTVHLLDLPGHGRSRNCDSFDLDTLSDQIHALLPPGCGVIAWSLSGLPALQIAAQSDRISRLMPVCSNPQFVQSEQWQYGMALSLLDKFSSQLQVDYQATVLRFLGLCTQGSEHMKNELRQLRSELLNVDMPDTEALACGLQLLQSTSLLTQIPLIKIPLHWVMGSHDRIVPPQAGMSAAQLTPGAMTTVIDKAAHLPFYSHTDEFVKTVQEFFHD